MAKGENVIETISRRSNLPYWWVESVAVEYFDCREYLVDGDFWSFDFNLLKEEDIRQIAQKKVVIGAYTLFQNIRSEDLKTRVMLALVGAPIMPLSAEIIPEGQVADHYVPWQLNSIDAWDPKLGFSNHAQVLDEGRFYQWKISEFYAIPGSHRGWFKSEFLDLEPLKQINEAIYDLRDKAKPNGSGPSRITRATVGEEYAQLEKARSILREKILQYHLSKKADKVLPHNPPPVVTYLDSLEFIGGEYLVRSHVEPLFYRRAIRSLDETRRIVQDRVKGKPDAISFVDEIELSAACIVFAALCMETYINLVGEEYCQSIWKDIFARGNLQTKWLLIPFTLGSMDCFDAHDKPYSDFLQVLGWRNRIVHYEHRFKKTQPVMGKKQASQIYSVCNLKNAEIALQTTKAMIERLSEKTRVPLPAWLQRTDEWLRLLPE
jgi:hypothetical protein